MQVSTPQVSTPQVSTVLPTLQVGDRGPAVIDLQSLLNKRFAGGRGGIIEPLTLDGFYGPKTEAAVKIAQFRYLLLQDGIAGPQTWRSLQADRALIEQLPTLARGDYGNAVTVLQSTLDPNQVGTVDGIFGRRTESAVKNFQAGTGLTVDGIVGSQTWKLVESRAKAQLV